MGQLWGGRFTKNTDEAVKAFKEGHLAELVKEANDKCIHRAEELGE